MSRTILSVAYPRAPGGPDSVGGAEQVLARLDRAITEAGHRSVVVASEGSTVRGTLVPTPRIEGTFDDGARALAQRNHREAIQAALARWQVDQIHLHGVDFLEYLPPAGPPALVTLHLPPAWYPEQAFRVDRPNTWLQCVSASQEKACPPDASLVPYVENGIPVERFQRTLRKRSWVLSLGRICPEKGFHLALDAAHLAGVSFLLAGEVYPYPDHVRYYNQEIVPRLDKFRRFIGPIGFQDKRRLFASAQCLLAPSLVPETSSLVAMEALASGTPVIAFPSGALADIVKDGRTGFLVKSVAEMVQAIQAVSALDPAVCRTAAQERFSSRRMIREYFELYNRLLQAPLSFDASTITQTEHFNSSVLAPS